MYVYLCEGKTKEIGHIMSLKKYFDVFLLKQCPLGNFRIQQLLDIDSSFLRRHSSVYQSLSLFWSVNFLRLCFVFYQYGFFSDSCTWRLCFLFYVLWSNAFLCYNKICKWICEVEPLHARFIVLTWSAQGRRKCENGFKIQ